MKKPVGLRIVAMIFTYLLLAALIVLFFVSHGQLLDVAGTWTYIIPMVLAAILVSIPRGMPFSCRSDIFTIGGAICPNCG